MGGCWIFLVKPQACCLSKELSAHVSSLPFLLATAIQRRATYEVTTLPPAALA